MVLSVLFSSCESFEEKKSKVLNERIEKCMGPYSDCINILNKHLDNAVKGNIITMKEKESIISLSNYKNDKINEALDKGSSMIQSSKCATIQCWLDEVEEFNAQQVVEKEKSHFEKGRDLINENDFISGIKELNIAIKENQMDALSYLWRGGAKRELKDYRGALLDYEKVIEIEPKDSEALSIIGDLYLEMESYNKALDCFNKVIELGEGSVLSNQIMLELDSNYKKSLIMYAYSYKADTFNKLGNNRRAINIISQLLVILDSSEKSMTEFSFNYQRKSAYIKRGEYKYEMDDKEGACLDWSKAGELGDSNAYEIIKEKCN